MKKLEAFTIGLDFFHLFVLLHTSAPHFSFTIFFVFMDWSFTDMISHIFPSIRCILVSFWTSYLHISISVSFTGVLMSWQASFLANEHTHVLHRFACSDLLELLSFSGWSTQTFSNI